MDDPTWITMELAVAIHQRQLAEHGGAEGVRDAGLAGLLVAALARPQLAYEFTDKSATPSIPNVAAAYAFGIACNHAFIDGNKRTAAVVCETFLELNGMTLNATDVELYPIFLSLAEGSLSEAELSTWLAAHTAKRE